MPFIHVRANVAIPPEKEKALAAGLGKAISLVPGKTESWLMLQFDENCRLYFKGDCAKPLAVVEVNLCGKSEPSSYNLLTGEISRLLNQELGVSADCAYVSYWETDHWGWNGGNF